MAFDDAEIARAISEKVSGADSVLVPGFPLANRAHARLARLLIEDDLVSGIRVGLYVEQPYASWHWLSRRLATPRAWRSAPCPRPLALPSTVAARAAWSRVGGRAADWTAKRRAALCYRSQLPLLRRWPLLRIALYEARRGGESVAWIDR